MSPDSGAASYFISASRTVGLFSGDRVWCESRRARRESQELPRIVWLERTGTTVMCRVVEGLSGLSLVPEQMCTVRLHLREADLPMVRAGDIVSVDVPAFAGSVKNLFGQPLSVSLRENLGPRPAGWTDSFMARYARSRARFDTQTVLEVKQAPVFNCPTSRGHTVDMLDYPFVTIDDASTLDVDDAVYAKCRQDGGWDLYVAIADVSRLAPPGSGLERRAYALGTSLYLPQGVFPMLPFSVSEQECSLLEGQERFVVVMQVGLSAEGQVLERRVYRAVIRSRHKMTYDEVSHFIQSPQSDDFDWSPAVRQSLLDLDRLSGAMQALRAERGLLDMESRDPVFHLRESGLWAVELRRPTAAHKLVEQCMILANESACELLMQRYGGALVRCQPPPTAESWARLKDWMASHGACLPDVPNLASLGRALEPLDEITRLEAIGRIQSGMAKAGYGWREAHEPAGHFSLNSAHYTHFTSPIRRYIDVVVHQLLLAPPGFALTDAHREQLREIAQHCTTRARLAQTAERFVMDLLRMQTIIREKQDQGDVVYPARVVRQSRHGLKVLLTHWQLWASVSAQVLIKFGLTWNVKQWEDSKGQALPFHLNVTPIDIDESLAGSPDLRMRPVCAE